MKKKERRVASVVSGEKIAVSVIIPTYNSAKFIGVLLDSLARQSMSSDLFEVIVINDCSTDETEKVVSGYKRKIKNLILLKTPHNTGNPIAGRNMGIDTAQGEYVYFIDHDDYLGDESLDRLYNAAKNWSSDVIFGRFVGVVNGKPASDKVVSIFKHGDIPKVDPFIHPDITSTLAPHRMFRRGLLVDKKIRYDANVKHGEDVYFVMTSFVNADVISVLTDYTYYYRVERQDGGNLTNHQKTGHDYYTKNFKTFRILEEINKSPLNDEYKQQWAKLYLQRYLGHKGHASHVLTLISDLYRMDVINKLVLAPAGKQVLDKLDPAYKLIVRLVELRESPERDTLLHSMLSPLPQDVCSRYGRTYIKAFDGMLYDASLLYTKTVIVIDKLSVKNNKLVVDVHANIVVKFKDNLKYYLKLEHTSSGRVVTLTGKKIADKKFRFEVDINHVLYIAEASRAEFAMSLLVKGDHVNITHYLYVGNVKNYSSHPINVLGERYIYRNHQRDDDRLVGYFETRKHVRFNRLKYLVKKYTRGNG